ncbi:MAG TPA: hypothetical protein VMH89_14935 [Candidatus Acidoferrum sp.]|jgi:hypothetical protein|nr:hypothetical protein [Candidatus Acidoferrum sp.]
MFYWGSGPDLGLLTCFGYAVFVLGAVSLWRHRTEFTFWVDDELTTLRRNFSRYVPVGPFYERRGESRLRVIPVGFVHSVVRLPRRRFSWGAFLVFLGMFLFALDFFV